MAFREDNSYHLDYVFNLASLHSLDGVLVKPAQADIHSGMTDL